MTERAVVVGGPARANRVARLLAVNVAACVLLLTQYLLGMVVNVYVVLPGRHPGAGAPDYFTGAVSGLDWVISDGPGWAAAHAAFGLALALAALASIALARRQDGRLALTLSVLGALAIVGAGFNGVSFLDYGHAFSSMIMAGLWALALACYLAGAILAARQLGGRSLFRRGAWFAGHALGLRAAADHTSMLTGGRRGAGRLAGRERRHQPLAELPAQAGRRVHRRGVQREPVAVRGRAGPGVADQVGHAGRAGDPGRPYVVAQRGGGRAVVTIQAVDRAGLTGLLR
jgi:hypothetical protein